MRLSYKSVLDRHVKGETNKSIAESLQILLEEAKDRIEEKLMIEGEFENEWY